MAFHDHADAGITFSIIGSGRYSMDEWMKNHDK
jgi:hypothetical protein